MASLNYALINLLVDLEVGTFFVKKKTRGRERKLWNKNGMFCTLSSWESVGSFRDCRRSQPSETSTLQSLQQTDLWFPPIHYLQYVEKIGLDFFKPTKENFEFLWTGLNNGTTLFLAIEDVKCLMTRTKMTLRLNSNNRSASHAIPINIKQHVTVYSNRRFKRRTWHEPNLIKG